MAVQLNPYLTFRDNAREAMEFYQSVFGGDLTIGTFAEMNAVKDPAENDLVMHSQLQGDNDIVLMASDTPPRMEYTPGNNINLSLSGDDEAALRGYFDKLSAGGTVAVSLEQASWGDVFGMCMDKFGITWLVNISGQTEAAGG